MADLYLQGCNNTWNHQRKLGQLDEVARHIPHMFLYTSMSESTFSIVASEKMWEAECMVIDVNLQNTN